MQRYMTPPDLWCSSMLMNVISMFVAKLLHVLVWRCAVSQSTTWQATPQPLSACGSDKLTSALVRTACSDPIFVIQAGGTSG